jgi:putative toxin-antitoxin system antitoxin component (TIGR02293 family)
MSAAVDQLLIKLKDPIKEMGLIRNGLKTREIESFLIKESLPVKDILKRLHISSSTYFTKKKNHRPLDTHVTEKFVRLISVMVMASDILGKSGAKNWLYRKIPSLGNEAPLDLLDTETGHRLVERALLQIKYGVYS